MNFCRLGKMFDLKEEALKNNERQSRSQGYLGADI